MSEALDPGQLFRGASGPFERALYALIEAEPKKLRIETLQPDLAALAGPTSIIVLLRWTADETVLRERIDALMPLSKARPLELAVIGGPEEVRAMLKKASPTFQANRVQIFHLGDQGGPWRGGSAEMFSSPLWKTLGLVAEHRAPEPDWDKLRAKIAEQAVTAAAQRQEIEAFAEVMSTRRPIVTYVILAVIAATFAMEYAFGGTDNRFVLVRMGALVAERVFAGEWWRLISCAFLHGGPFHLVMNGYVLFALGPSLERIFGARRFLILYTLSAVAGSITSALVHPDGTSVGASGALWGLLGADAVLAFRPSGILPSVTAERMKKAVWTNLFMNVIISFQPNVDAAAHFGGGAMGALLVISGLLTIGLPRITEAREGAADRPPFWLAPMSWLCAAALAIGFGLALAHGKVWELGRERAFVRVESPELRLSLEIPEGLSKRAGDSSKSVTYGDLTNDPLAVWVATASVTPPIPEEHLEAELETVVKPLSTPPKPAKTKIEAAKKTIGGRPGVLVRFEFPSGLLVDRGAVILPEGIRRVEVYFWPEFVDVYAESPAERILASMKSLEDRP